MYKSNLYLIVFVKDLRIHQFMAVCLLLIIFNVSI